MRKQQNKKRNELPNFILVDETLYHRFAEFCKTFGYHSMFTDHPEPFFSNPNQKITELPEKFSNFILIDNQTGRVIR